MNIPNLLAVMSRKYPNHEGIVTPSERVTYSEWNEAVNRFAHSLEDLGVKKGDKVALQMPNTKEFLIAYVAVQRIGALSVPINARLIGQEVMYILDDSDASVFITHELIFEQVRHLPEQSSEIKFIKTGSAERPASERFNYRNQMQSHRR